jgi:uncharacterized protein YjbJ (UPF0337 family)
MKLASRFAVVGVLTGAMTSVSVVHAGAGPIHQWPQLRGGQPHRSIAQVVANEDQLAGLWKQFKGELKEKWAQFTDDDLLSIEGRVDKLEGKIQERYGDRREEVKAWVDQWFDSHRMQKDPPQS